MWMFQFRFTPMVIVMGIVMLGMHAYDVFACGGAAEVPWSDARGALASVSLMLGTHGYDSLLVVVP